MVQNKRSLCGIIIFLSLLLLYTRLIEASGLYFSLEPEEGTLESNVQTVSNSTVSSGKYIVFGGIVSPTPAINPVVVAAVGDMVCGSGSTGAACRHNEVSDVVVSMSPDAFLALGDIQYEEGGYQDFITMYEPSFGRFKNVTHPAVGNHEYLTTGASGYFDYYNGIGVQNGPAGERTKGYYAFNVGQWRLYALNSNCSQAGGCGATSPQGNWLRSDLAANPKACVLAFYHHPLRSTGPRANPSVLPLVQILYDANAEIVLAGHEHNYERFDPQTPDGVLDTARGIREFIIGTGGRNFTQFSSTIASNSVIRKADTYGVLKLTLYPNSYDWEFVRANFSGNGTFAEKFTNNPCH